jgi:hypothetical protein
MDNRKRELRDYKKSADHAVNGFEHLWDPFSHVISDVNARGEGAFPATPEHQKVCPAIIPKRLQDLSEFAQHRKIQDVKGWTVHRKVDRSFSLFSQYIHDGIQSKLSLQGGQNILLS